MSALGEFCSLIMSNNTEVISYFSEGLFLTKIPEKCKTWNFFSKKASSKILLLTGLNK